MTFGSRKKSQNIEKYNTIQYNTNKIGTYIEFLIFRYSDFFF
jgi:hypothetical protein